MVQSVQNIVEKGDRARNPSSCPTFSYVFSRIEDHYFVELDNVVSQRGTKWSSKVIDRWRSWQMQERSPVPYTLLWVSLTTCSGRREHRDIAKMVERGVQGRCCCKLISNNKQSRNSWVLGWNIKMIRFLWCRLNRSDIWRYGSCTELNTACCKNHPFKL